MGLGFANPKAAGSHWISTQLPTRTRPAAINTTTKSLFFMPLLESSYDPGATLEDLREAVTTLEDTTRISRRVFGASHPSTTGHEEALLRARETTSNKTTIYFLPLNSLCRFGFCFGASVDPYSR